MGVVKSIFGSLIGAVVGVGIYYVIKQTTDQTYIWFPLVIGVLTGIAARMFAGSLGSNSDRLISGAFAGLIAGAAILGIEFAPTILAKQNEFGPIELDERLNSEAAAMQTAKAEPKTDPDAADESDQMKIAGDDQRSDDVADAATDDNKNDAADQVEPDDAREPNAGSASQESDRVSDDQVADDAVGTTPATPGDSTIPESRDQSRTPQNLPVNSETDSKRLKDLIRKQSHQTWYNFVMPYVFTGLGMLVAYQIARGFGSANPKS